MTEQIPCQDVPRTDRKISTAKQFSRAVEARCSHAKGSPPKLPPLRASMALNRQQMSIQQRRGRPDFLRKFEPHAARSERLRGSLRHRPLFDNCCGASPRGSRACLNASTHFRLRRYLGTETAGCPPPAGQCNLRPRFGFTDIRVTQFTEMLWARGTPAPLVTLWKPLAPLRRGFSLRSSSPRHSLPLIEVWLLTHPPHIAGPHTRT
jgi:hypothetical protein